MPRPNERVQKINERFENLKSERQFWLPLYQQVAEYLRSRRQDFLKTTTPGQFINKEIFDNTGEFSRNILAATMVGALWPNGARSLVIEAPEEMKALQLEDEETKKYYEYVTTKLVSAIDHITAGFQTTLDEYANDLGDFGTSGIAVYERPDDDDAPVYFTTVDAKIACLDENEFGIVDTVYQELQMTVRQLVLKYGFENVSPQSQEKFKKNELNEKVTVLHAIEPRIDRDPTKFGNDNMPIGSIHIEVDTKHILKESGFNEMPIFIVRFWKLIGEKRGRSPGMSALPDILELNAIREAIPIAIEKNLEPPLNVYDDGNMGGGDIDTSAGAINVISVSGRIQSNLKPIEPMYTVGELKSAEVRAEQLSNNISKHFFVDRLLDFNNETRMTLGEAQIRDQLRSQSLNSMYARQIREFLTPMVERVFNIMLRRGLLGIAQGDPREEELLNRGIMPTYIPQKVLDFMVRGRDVYKIRFISPAARMMQMEELTGIQRTLEMAVGVAPVMPDVIDHIDDREAIRLAVELTGAPSPILRAADTVKKIRDARQQQMQAAQQGQEALGATQGVKNLAQAAAAAGGPQGGAA